MHVNNAIKLRSVLDIAYSACTHPTCIVSMQVPPDGSTCAWVTSVDCEFEFGEVDIPRMDTDWGSRRVG